MIKKIAISLVLLILLVFILQSPVDAQCAMCKAVAETGTEESGESVSKGLNNGILYLMGIPYVILFLLFRKQLVSLIKELTSS